jgi:formylglycine-generating enzyme required for sulfatase activity
MSATVAAPPPIVTTAHRLDESIAGFTGSQTVQNSSSPGTEVKLPIPPRTPLEAVKKYWKQMQASTAEIDIRALHIVTTDVRCFGMEEIYIPLRFLNPEYYVAEHRSERSKLRETDAWTTANASVKEMLQKRLLVIAGDPGAGKTTTLKRFAYLVSLAQLQEDPTQVEVELGLARDTFAVLVRLEKLAEHIVSSKKQSKGPTTSNSPEWLIDFLKTTNAEQNVNLDDSFFRETLQHSPSLLLLDGLDEPNSEQQREELTELIRAISVSYEQCRVVVTSRPTAYKGQSVIPGFEVFHIEPLNDVAIERYLTLWFGTLLQNTDAERSQYACKKLLTDMRTRPELLRLARNPLMLTALAVVNWTDSQQILEQRTELYASIIRWLSRSRKSSHRRTEDLLQELALKMLWDSEGSKLQILRLAAARKISSEFREVAAKNRLEAAVKFLEEEELNSGIVVARGKEISFWHPTFQEYLAARAISSRSDKEQLSLLSALPKGRSNRRVFDQEWRETVLLFFGILYSHGHRKVDRLLSSLLKRLGNQPSPSDLCNFVALIGAIHAELSPLDYIPDYSVYNSTFLEVRNIYDTSWATEIPIEVSIQVADVLGQSGDHRFLEAIKGNNWVTIPAGKFYMGSQNMDPHARNFDLEALNMESPVHEVLLQEYQFCRYPVTVGEYKLFLEQGGYSNQDYWTEGHFEKWVAPENWKEQLRHPNRPVVGVSWYEAAAYARWAKCRLPTEAEWERAVRGPGGRTYPWGENTPISNLMNYGIVNVGHPTPVGVYPLGATPDGIMDCAGNVWEWCHDWFDPYYYDCSPTEKPRGPMPTSSRVMRGGAWDSVEFHCRSAYRDCFRPDLRANVLGFRLAR